MKFKQLVFLLSVVGIVLLPSAIYARETCYAGTYNYDKVSGCTQCPTRCYCKGNVGHESNGWSGCEITECLPSQSKPIRRSGSCSHETNNFDNTGVYSCPSDYPNTGDLGNSAKEDCYAVVTAGNCSTSITSPSTTISCTDSIFQNKYYNDNGRVFYGSFGYSCPSVTGNWYRVATDGKYCEKRLNGSNLSSTCVANSYVHQTGKTSWSSTSATYLKAKAGARIWSNGTDFSCEKCTGNTYTDSENQKSSCDPCPSATKGWTQGINPDRELSGKTEGERDSKSKCMQTKTPDNCSKGSIIQYYDAENNMYETVKIGRKTVAKTSVYVSLEANAGYYVADTNGNYTSDWSKGIQCKECPKGQYCAGGTAAPVPCPDPLEKDDNGNPGKNWASSYKGMATAQNVASRPSETGAIIYWVKNNENAADNYTSESECTVLVKQSGDGCNKDYEDDFKKGIAGFKYVYSTTQGGYYPIGALTKDGVSTVKAKKGYWVWGSHCHQCDEGTVQTSNENTGGQESCKTCSADKYAMYDRSECVACTDSGQYADEKICRACPSKPDWCDPSTCFWYKKPGVTTVSSKSECRYRKSLDGCGIFISNNSMHKDIGVMKHNGKDGADGAYVFNKTDSEEYVKKYCEDHEISANCDGIPALSKYYVANSYDETRKSICLPCPNNRPYSDGGAIGSDMCYTCGEGRCLATVMGIETCKPCSAGFACPAKSDGTAQKCKSKTELGIDDIQGDFYGVKMCGVDQYSTVSTADGAAGPEKCSSCTSGYTTKGSDKCWNQNEGKACYSADACTLKTIKFKIGTETFEWPKCVIQGKIQNQ